MGVPRHERGELRPDIDAELVVDMLAGPMIYRFIIDAGEMADPVERALRVLDTLVEGIGG
ncbi:MAG: TetR/AcrR family transcriptional regulator C-terminal ligand-binding domain-containing protein [Actinomycetota bacterium]|nr:TetR/AcrR family transcriptional regulator C-terminal ligand-binding domain-containing protein [Actinomycetota bacterium]MDQ5808881.1 TetR/AcrR family transcriptional regulator C-terminal ligand-binding domain-containing protein [Actinomycetota bacterium]